MQKTETTERQDVYTRITAQIVASLEMGVRPWVKPWNAEHAAGRITRPLRHNGQPYSFAPMSSRERRMLHLAFRAYDDIETSSTGEGLRRFVVAHPKGYDVTKLATLAVRPPLGGGGHGRR